MHSRYRFVYIQILYGMYMFIPTVWAHIMEICDTFLRSLLFKIFVYFFRQLKAGRQAHSNILFLILTSLLITLHATNTSKYFRLFENLVVALKYREMFK